MADCLGGNVFFTAQAWYPSLNPRFVCNAGVPDLADAAAVMPVQQPGAGQLTAAAAAGAAGGAERGGATPGHRYALVVIDGTWLHAREMFEVGQRCLVFCSRPPPGGSLRVHTVTCTP